MILAIDPGATGAIAWRESGGTVRIAKMPATPTGVLINLRALASCGYATAILENVGFHRKGNKASASVKFARGVGQLEMACIASELAIERVTPQAWMKVLLPTRSKEKAVRKNQIHARVQELCPGVNIPKYAADAVGILLAWERTHAPTPRVEHGYLPAPVRSQRGRDDV